MDSKMRLPSLQVRPTTRFYLILFLMATTLFASIATGFDLLVRLLYILGLAIVISYVWNWMTVSSLEVTVGRRARQARVGDAIEETLAVRNNSRLPKHALEVEDITDLPGHRGGTAINLSGNLLNYARSHVTWEMQMPAHKRGVYTLGPVRVANTDPFGLFRRGRSFGKADSVIVYPRTFDLPGFDIPATDLSSDSAISKRTHTITPQASTVREYASGDSLSRVHWNSTARMGKLMSKEFDLGRSGEIWVLVDLHREVQAGELEESTDEYAVSIGASLAKMYLEAQMPVGLITYGAQRHFVAAETGTGQMHRILQYLAISKAEGSTPLEVVLPKEEPLWSHHSTLIVVTPSPREEWVVALRELARRGVGVAVVLVDGNSFGGHLNTLDALDPLHQAGLTVYVVKRGDDIPSALVRKNGGVAPMALKQPEEAGAKV